MKRKRLFFIFLVLCLAIISVPISAGATDSVVISEENFPDDIFRAYILKQSYGKDGILTSEELRNVDFINVQYSNVRDLTGIEVFTSIKELYCEGNLLTSIDVSNNTELRILICKENQLTELDVSQNTALEWLHCEDNQLVTLDVTQNVALTDLRCDRNGLTDLDLSKNVELVELFCCENQLSSLDLSHSTKLTQVRCWKNLLKELNLDNTHALEELVCSDNQLTGLDVTHGIALKDLRCSDNRLTALNLTNNTVLEYLDCGGNQLTTLNLLNNTELETVWCGSNQLTSLDVSGNTKLRYIGCAWNSYTLQGTYLCGDKFDLTTLPGNFDVTRTSDWYGGTVEGNMLTITGDSISYTYQIDDSRTETFTLVLEFTHVPGTAEMEIERTPTCTVAGSYYEVVRCTGCNFELSREYKIAEALGHTPGTSVRENEKTASCKASGSYDEAVYCTVCNEEISRKTVTVEALGHADNEPSDHICDCCDDVMSECFDADNDGKCDICGKLMDVIRLAGTNRFDTAIKVADEMKVVLGTEKFYAIILANGYNFADALAGSYLSAVKNAPILLTWNGAEKYNYLNDATIQYVKDNLKPGGTVYILGGTAAVPASIDAALAQFNVERMDGANRFETNIMILEEAGVQPSSEVLVCTSTNFADSLSASAAAKPILLVWNEGGKLFDVQKDYLAKLRSCTFTIIGGESAVSVNMAATLMSYGAVSRLAGGNRFETSVLVAEKYFPDATSAVLAYAWDFPDGLCGGALAYSMKAPLILTMTKYEAKAVEYAKAAGIETGLVLGGETLISDEAVRAIFAMAAEDTIIVKK